MTVRNTIVPLEFDSQRSKATGREPAGRAHRIRNTPQECKLVPGVELIYLLRVLHSSKSLSVCHDSDLKAHFP